MPHQSTITWLKTACIILIGFGLLGLSGTVPALSGLANIFIDLAYWPLDGAPNSGAPETRLFWAIMGGILCGWGVMLWQLTTRLYPVNPDLARSMILKSIGTWFVIDGAGSVLSGAPMNALFNVSFLLLFAVPLLRSPRAKQAG